jgi:hypothetical protein
MYEYIYICKSFQRRVSIQYSPLFTILNVLFQLFKKFSLCNIRKHTKFSSSSRLRSFYFSFHYSSLQTVSSQDVTKPTYFSLSYCLQYYSFFIQSSKYFFIPYFVRPFDALYFSLQPYFKTLQVLLFLLSQ